MQRLFILSPTTGATSALVEGFRLADGLGRRIRVVAPEHIADELEVPAATLEQLTDVRNARGRALLVGMLTGLAVVLVLVGLGFDAGLPTSGLLLAGAVGGGALGVAIGTLIGPTEPHPIFEAHQEDIDSGAVLLAIDSPEDRVEEAVLLARRIEPKVQIEVRTLTDVEAR
ncbi:MAG: hypothetical protein R3200_15765 [Xanthomonadales bacterium]|nr:hypothetical protein [Xanthomonadales bacterium]